MTILSYFLPMAPMVMVYMLQQLEYDSVKFAQWIAKVPDLSDVQKRQRLDKTPRAIVTLIAGYTAWLVPILAGVAACLLSGSILPLLLVITAPIIAAASLMAFNSFFAMFIVYPQQNKEISAAKSKLADMEAVRIAVLGSYGKTTMKELLATVLSEGKKVAATPGNKNVLISHARWVNQLDGDEDVLIFEYGEYIPGDIERLAAFSQPDYAFITGIAPAHLDNYGSLDAVADDFKDVYQFTDEENIYINRDSKELHNRIARGVPYTQESCGKWHALEISSKLEGTTFKAKNGSTIKLKSRLLGEHMVGPLLGCVAIADRLGFTGKQISEGVANTKPFEHRMQPYRVGPAWVIDDTYNGNLEGMKAGLSFLAHIKAKRKMYVTPGLVEQGELSETVHGELGLEIARSGVDVVVLMENSATAAIKAGLTSAGYEGQLKIEPNPLEFYTNLEHYIAGGDVVLMQNDWPDAYR